MLPDRPRPPLRVAVSDCLLGSPVRYDGGHKRSALCHERLAGLFEFRGVCPEVAIGLGVPRQPIQLIGDAARPRAVHVHDPSMDVTERLAAFAADVVDRLSDISGYIFIEGSPSCGLFDVKVHSHSPDAAAERGRGIFAAEITRLLPELPVEESGRLADAACRDNFVARVFAYAHWQRFVEAGVSAADLIEFHSRYKYLLMAHDVARYRQAGRLLGDPSDGLGPIAARYFALLMAGLTRPVTRGGHTNVLQHLSGYFKDRLDAMERRELEQLVAAYRDEQVPLEAALARLRHHASQLPDDYLALQVYLEPRPSVAAAHRSVR